MQPTKTYSVLLAGSSGRALQRPKLHAASGYHHSLQVSTGQSCGGQANTHLALCSKRTAAAQISLHFCMKAARTCAKTLCADAAVIAVETAAKHVSPGMLNMMHNIPGVGSNHIPDVRWRPCLCKLQVHQSV